MRCDLNLSPFCLPLIRALLLLFCCPRPKTLARRCYTNQPSNLPIIHTFLSLVEALRVVSSPSVCFDVLFYEAVLDSRCDALARVASFSHYPVLFFPFLPFVLHCLVLFSPFVFQRSMESPLRTYDGYARPTARCNDGMEWNGLKWIYMDLVPG
ncbi:hypothetical protein BC567DRAFT_85974 [Phyllosticta citribraziliensis]